MRTEEGALKVRCRAYLTKIGAYRFSPVQQGYGAPTLDDLCCIKGRFIGVEYKAPGKEPTPRQQQTMSAISCAGGMAFWCDSYETFLFQLKVRGLIPE